jgi:hypothetical protein
MKTGFSRAVLFVPVILALSSRDLIIVVTGGNEDNGKHFAIMEVLGRYF